jgi:hypothetical protein
MSVCRQLPAAAISVKNDLRPVQHCGDSYVREGKSF